MSAMDELDVIRIRLALQDLNATFNYALDHDRIDQLLDLFTEDAVYTHGERRSVGRTEIRALFAARGAAGVRTTRHMSADLLLQIESASAAGGHSVCMTFAADSAPPISPAAPFLVADFEDQYRLCSDGRWRIASRHIRRIFTATGNPGPVGTRAGVSS
jgi:ketosteroid isomerase-like protein